MRGDRATRLIGGKAAQTYYYAAMQADRLGHPFTHAVTINYALTDVDPRRAVAAFADLRNKMFSKWATRPRRGAGPAFPPTYAFAFENVRDGRLFDRMEPGDPHNVHVHWEVHIHPARLHDFTNDLWRWVEKTTGGIHDTGEAIRVRPLFHRTGYLSKGTSSALARIYGRGREAEPQGIILGRRADTSRNVGPKQRRRADRALGIKRQLPKRLSSYRRFPGRTLRADSGAWIPSPPYPAR